MKTITSVLAGMLIGAAAVVGAQHTVKGGYIVERDADVAKKEPGTTTAAATPSATRSSPRRHTCRSCSGSAP